MLGSDGDTKENPDDIHEFERMLINVWASYRIATFSFLSTSYVFFYETIDSLLFSLPASCSLHAGVLRKLSG